jgi:hypothetical protein
LAGEVQAQLKELIDAKEYFLFVMDEKCLGDKAT